MKMKNINVNEITFIAIKSNKYEVANGLVEVQDDDVEIAQGLGFKIVHEDVKTEVTEAKKTSKKEVNADKSK